MNIQFLPGSLAMLAGGSIDGDKRPLDGGEIAGVTLAGLGIVFACLVILVLVIFMFGKIFDAINRKKKNKEAAAAALKAPKAPAPKPAAPKVPALKAAPPKTADGDEDEVVAVISAVIAAMSAADGKKYKIHSVKPVTGSRAAWAMDGRRQNTMPF